MTGYMIAMGDCFVCHRLFHFNPDRVPSHRDENGVRQPICGDCIEKANAVRKTNGLEPIVPLPGAYEPTEEGGWNDE